jgi:hypothetical protein
LISVNSMSTLEVHKLFVSEYKAVTSHISVL